MMNAFTLEKKVPIHVALEPVSNALNSLALLNEVEHLPGLNAWVVQTAATLTPEQRHKHRLVFEGLRDTLTPLRDESNFPSYLHNLAEMNRYILRKRVLEPLRHRFSRLVSYATPDTKRLLSDTQAYLYCVQQVQGERFDAELQTEVHSLLQDPTAMQMLLLEHLEMMWKTTFVAEWRRVQRSLQWQVDMFTQSLAESATLDETFYDFTGRHLVTAIPRPSADVSEIVLIPSWHTGRNVITWDWTDWDGEGISFGKQEMLRLFFSEPPNYDVAWLRSNPMKQGELRARLDMLADEIGLRIIELLVQRDGMSAQEIISTLELSQSSVSRHLKHLASMGYLYERRGEGANKTYRLSSFYFARTAHAIEQLVLGEEASTASKVENEASKQSQELRRFLDKSGKLTMWPPAKQRDKLFILEYLVSFFKPGQVYNEKEVNEILTQHSVIKDNAALRRALYEFRFVNRERDGSRYWLTGTLTDEDDRA